MRIVESPDQTLDRAGRRASVRRSGALGATGVLVAGSAAALLAAFAGNAGAVSTITVDSAADGVADASHCTDGAPDNCTLRDAAAAAADGDTIAFGPSISTITLTQTVATGAVNITGSGSTALTITAAPGAYEAFYIGGTGDVVLSGFTLTTNRIKAKNDGKLTLDGVSVTGSTGSFGGALYAGNTGDLAITDSTFDNNTALIDAGVVYVYNGGATTITGSSFTNNEAAGEGGAIVAKGGGSAFTLINSVVTGNSTTDGGGGGVYLYKTGAIMIDRSTIGNNTSGTDGGGVYATANDAFTMLDSTVNGNGARDGGGLKLGGNGPTLIANSTIADNQSIGIVGRGAAIFSWGNAGGGIDVLLTTISGNSSNGTFPQPSTTVQLCLYSPNYDTNLTGTIISDNTTKSGTGVAATDLYLGCSGPGRITLTNSLVMGLIDANQAPVDDYIDGGGNLFAVSAQLGALADNGGATFTMAPADGSPVIDAGPSTWPTFTGDTSDQRGAPWLRIYNGQADIGAFEVQPVPVPPTTSTTVEPTTTMSAIKDEVVPVFTG